MGNSPSSVPYGAQSNAIHIPASCTFGPWPFDITVSLTTPLSGGSGQQISITDFAAKVILPPQFIGTIQDYGASSYQANTTITIETTNGTPNTLSVTGYSPRYTVSGGNLELDVPERGRFPGDVTTLGPITLGSPGQSDIKLQKIHIDSQLYNGGGEPVAPNVPDYQIDCNFNPEPIISSIAVDNEPVVPLLAPASNAQSSNIPALGSKSISANVPLNCTQDRYYPYGLAINYTLMATAPALLAANQAFDLSDVNHYVTLPRDFAGAVNAPQTRGTCGIFLTLRPADGLPGLGLNLSSASPGSFDASSGYTASDSSTPRQLQTGHYVTCGDTSAPVVFALPYRGYVNYTDITAGSSGSAFALSFNGLKGRVEGVSAGYGDNQVAGITCTPLSSSILLSAPIS